MQKIFLLLFLNLIIITAQAHGGSHLGDIYFPTSGNQSAQTYFIEGVKLLHSFEYPEARTAFQRAEKLDPNFAMAYWGEAMTYNHPLWSEQDQPAAITVLNKLAAVKGQLTAKEKGFIHAIQTLYGAGDKKSRDIAYAEEMRALYRQFSDDDEIASFYALALLGATEGERDSRSFMQSAGIVEEIYSRNPCHPGAIHYAIHSYDDPIHAPLGLRAARMYAKMAPDASHALHMPSHIFLALGMWEDVIASNKAAWEAGYKQNKKAEAYTIDDLHAAQWLSYGYLQTKQYEKAFQLTKIVEGIAEKTKTSMAIWYYAVMRAAYLNESQQWQANLKSLTLSNLELSARATDVYINAMIALKQTKSNIALAKALRKQLQAMIPKQTLKQETHQDYFTALLPSGVAAANIMLLEISAQIDLQEGLNKRALTLLKQAIQLEDADTSFGYGPPIPVQPSYEVLAQKLFNAGQYQAAYELYVKSLKRTPQREQSLQGIKETRDALMVANLSVPEVEHPYFNRLMLPDYYK